MYKSVIDIENQFDKIEYLIVKRQSQAVPWDGSSVFKRKEWVNTLSSWFLTFYLLAANLVNTKYCEKSWKITEPLVRGYSYVILNKSYSMNTNMTGFRWLSKWYFVLWSKVASALEGLNFQVTDLAEIELHVIRWIRHSPTYTAICVLKGQWYHFLKLPYGMGILVTLPNRPVLAATSAFSLLLMQMTRNPVKWYLQMGCF